MLVFANFELGDVLLVVGVVLLLLLGIVVVRRWTHEASQRTCPACKSEVPSDASICRHCRSPLSPPAVNADSGPGI